MLLRLFILFCFAAGGGTAIGQDRRGAALLDTAVYDYDEIFSELDALLDSLYTPRSFAVATLGAGTGFLNYTTTTAATSRRQLILSPSVAYYNKSGLGASLGASVTNTGAGFVPFQYSLTGSYDYLKTPSLITGLSVTRIFTRNNLSFYTSPLQNELYGYFTYRRHWLKPSLSASYGWGSRASVQQQEEKIRRLNRLRRNTPQVTTTTTYETVADFNLLASVRHDFFLLHLLTKTDYARITPQLSFTSGTQQFGFNAVSTSYHVARRVGRNVITGTENVTLDNNLAFRPLSLTAQLRTEYTSGNFFLQPQLFVDYYFPASTGNLTTTFLVNAGVIF